MLLVLLVLLLMVRRGPRVGPVMLSAVLTIIEGLLMTMMVLLVVVVLLRLLVLLMMMLLVLLMVRLLVLFMMMLLVLFMMRLLVLLMVRLMLMVSMLRLLLTLVVLASDQGRKEEGAESLIDATLGASVESSLLLHNVLQSLLGVDATAELVSKALERIC